MYKVIRSADDFIPDPPAEGPNDYKEPIEVDDSDAFIDVYIVDDTVKYGENEYTFGSENSQGYPSWLDPDSTNNKISAYSYMGDYAYDNYVEHEAPYKADEALEYVCDIIEGAIKKKYPEESSDSKDHTYQITKLSIQVPFTISNVTDDADYSQGSFEEGSDNDADYNFENAEMTLDRSNAKISKDTKAAEDCITLVK